MSFSWDPFPLPTRGDDSAELTYQWAGRAISQWEHIEFHLAITYTIFSGHPYNGDATREYGAGRIFRERLGILRRVAETYFISNSHQNLEAEFDGICTAAEGFADRRNEVAHAIVFPTRFLPSFKNDRMIQQERWALTPPYFTVRNYDNQGFAKYAYTSRELHQLVMRLKYLLQRVEAFQAALMKASGLPPG